MSALPAQPSNSLPRIGSQEKRDKILEVFHESKEVFILKVREGRVLTLRAACGWPRLLRPRPGALRRVLCAGGREEGGGEGRRAPEREGRPPDPRG